MAGMLAYGAMSGVADEALKQGDERRENEFQQLRDTRLSEMKKGEATHAASLVTTENQRAEAHANSNYTLGYGQDKYVNGELANSGRNRPTAGTTLKPDEMPITLVSGDTTTDEMLRKQYDTIVKANRDDFGRPIGDFDLPDFDTWRNARVMEKHRINPKTGEKEIVLEVKPEDGPGGIRQLWDWAMKKLTPTNDVDSQGQPVDEAGNRVPTVADTPGVNTNGGLLSQGTAPAKTDKAPAAAEVVTPQDYKATGPKVKLTLSQAAKEDPNTMYWEMQDQAMENPDVSEQDMEDFIRRFFKNPDWVRPKD